MIFVMNIGNTNISSGLYKEKKLVSSWRTAADRGKTEDDFGLQLLSLLQSAQVSKDSVEGVIISSVVPPLVFPVKQACKKYLGCDPLIIGPGIKTGLNIRYENPREVGADRIVNAVAALQEQNGPFIIVDFGTATTFCYVDGNNQYIGGIISPGLNISAEALYEQAAKLPRVELKKPAGLIGRNTIDAMHSGIYYGHAAMVDGIIRRIKKQVGENAFVIATGGIAPFISKASETIDKVDAYMTLHGLSIIYEKNK
ncbi:type III pantothenate kinase [Alteribacillus sp. HJP-4]|uniref:type III pantothenate kinase n=1 Tax=Alteribacillus sp. HJP-4 TaxID=2775394 RepID=UPI0035CD1776